MAKYAASVSCYPSSSKNSEAQHNRLFSHILAKLSVQNLLGGLHYREWLWGSFYCQDTFFCCETTVTDMDFSLSTAAIHFTNYTAYIQ